MALRSPSASALARAVWPPAGRRGCPGFPLLSVISALPLCGGPLAGACRAPRLSSGVPPQEPGVRPALCACPGTAWVRVAPASLWASASPWRLRPLCCPPAWPQSPPLAVLDKGDPRSSRGTGLGLTLRGPGHPRRHALGISKYQALSWQRRLPVGHFAESAIRAVVGDTAEGGRPGVGVAVWSVLSGRLRAREPCRPARSARKARAAPCSRTPAGLRSPAAAQCRHQLGFGGARERSDTALQPLLSRAGVAAAHVPARTCAN